MHGRGQISSADECAEASPLLCYTVGYGGWQPHELLTLLRQHEIRTVVDVRLRPDQSHMGLYAQARSPEKGISRFLHTNGIQYVSVVELGNVFRGDACWHQRYHRLMQQAGHILTERLSSIPGPICLLCAEKRVAECHRLYIAEYLIQQGWEVHHIE